MNAKIACFPETLDYAHEKLFRLYLPGQNLHFYEYPEQLIKELDASFNLVISGMNCNPGDIYKGRGVDRVGLYLYDDLQGYDGKRDVPFMFFHSAVHSDDIIGEIKKRNIIQLTFPEGWRDLQKTAQKLIRESFM